jgi:hypothetical protein
MATSPQQPAGEPAEDDVHRKFREALERKQAKSRSGQGEEHLNTRGVGPASNDKHQRQFRRKSG